MPEHSSRRFLVSLSLSWLTCTCIYPWRILRTTKSSWMRWKVFFIVAAVRLGLAKRRQPGKRKELHLDAFISSHAYDIHQFFRTYCWSFRSQQCFAVTILCNGPHTSRTVTMIFQAPLKMKMISILCSFQPCNAFRSASGKAVFEAFLRSLESGMQPLECTSSYYYQN